MLLHTLYTLIHLSHLCMLIQVAYLHIYFVVTMLTYLAEGLFSLSVWIAVLKIVVRGEVEGREREREGGGAMAPWFQEII